MNTTLLYVGVYDFVASPMVLHDPFYLGGIPSNKSSQLPYALCFKGGMKNLIIDSRYFKWNKPFNGRALLVTSVFFCFTLVQRYKYYFIFLQFCSLRLVRRRCFNLCFYKVTCRSNLILKTILLTLRPEHSLKRNNSNDFPDRFAFIICRE